jgi:toxin ParE1/3/4
VNLFVTQEAEQDLDQIEEYIGRDNPVAALKYIQRLTDRVEQLAVYPGVGCARPEYGQGVRSVSEDDYVINVPKWAGHFDIAVNCVAFVNQ